MASNIVVVRGKKVLGKKLFRRDNDLFIDNLRKSMRSTQTIEESLSTALLVLKSRSYVSPRIYVSRGTDCLLVSGLDLPPGVIPQQTKFGSSSPILEDLIHQHDTYINEDVHADQSLIVGSSDPLLQIPERGLIGIPFDFQADIAGRESCGAIVMNYDPDQKKINLGEIRLLYNAGQLIGEKVESFLLQQQYRTKREELLRANEQLLRQVKIDGATGLYNKRTFHEDLEKYLAAVKVNPHPLYLLLMDLDNFKRINEQHGHVAGDVFIEQWGKYLQSLPDVTVYRAGGDKFAIIVDNLGEHTEAQIVALAKDIKHNLTRLPTPQGCARMTLSQGIVIADPAFETGEEWYILAKVALEEAKKTRNTGMYLALGSGKDPIQHVALYSG